MDQLLRDLRFALRSLLKRPALFGIATISLALGISANTTIFAAINGFMLTPLPYPDANRILQVWTTNPSRGWTRASTSIPDYLDWKRESKSMDIAAFNGGSYNLAEEDRPERVQGSRVTPSFFKVMGTPPLAGRTFAAEEELPGAAKVVVIGNAFWKRRFAGDPSTVGKVVKLNGEPFTVIGIMPEKFRFPDLTTDIWTPLVHDGTEKRVNRAVKVVAHLRPGFDKGTADGELATIASRLAKQFDEDKGISASAQTLQQAILGDGFNRGAAVSTVAVVFVLLIACANVANLLLARATGRARELALRTAVGASRGRLIRQLLTESIVLALAGGVLGAILSIWGIKALVSIFPPDLPGAENVVLNGRALAYTLGISIFAGIVFGVAPALSATKAGISNVLREGGRSGTMSLHRNRLGASLVVTEIALALVLLISAGLLIKGAILTQTLDLGFEPDNVLTMRLTLPANQYADTTRVLALQDELLARLRAVPGVASAGATSILPTQGGSGTSYAIEGQPKPEADKMPVSQYRVIMPGYLKTMRFRLARGREFTDGDQFHGADAMLVNESFAKKNWPKDDAIGKRVIIQTAAGSTPCEIVGIVGDVHEFGPDSPVPDMMYLAAHQRPQRTLAIVMRSTIDPATLANAARTQLAGIDRTIPAYAVQTMREILVQGQKGDMIMPRLLAVFGGIALLLAVVGVYGVMSYSVNQRTQEVGIRMALGAEGGDIVRLVLRQGATLAVAGLVIGLGVALLTTRTLSFFLQGVSAFDPTVFVGVSAALTGAAMVASFIPALRAVRVDPLVALRHD
jgi:putative ABC transport system permease protein